MNPQQDHSSLVRVAASPAPLEGPSAHPKLAWIVRRIVARLTAHTEAHRQQVAVELAHAIERLEGEVARLDEQSRLQEERIMQLRGEVVMEAARRLAAPLRAAEARTGELEDRLKELASRVARSGRPADRPSPLDGMEQRLTQITRELHHPVPEDAAGNPTTIPSGNGSADPEPSRQK